MSLKTPQTSSKKKQDQLQELKKCHKIIFFSAEHQIDYHQI